MFSYVILQFWLNEDRGTSMAIGYLRNLKILIRATRFVGRADFSDQFRKIIVRYKRIGYNINIMRQSACLGLTQSRLITLLPSLIARRWVGRQTQ